MFDSSLGQHLFSHLKEITSSTLKEHELEVLKALDWEAGRQNAQRIETRDTLDLLDARKPVLFKHYVYSYHICFRERRGTSIQKISKSLINLELLGWRPSLVGWRPLRAGWRPSLLGLEALAIRLDAIASSHCE